MSDHAPRSACCGVCAAPTGDGALLCRSHVRDLEAQLNSVPALLPELEVTVTRQDKLTVFTDRKTTAETPLQWNERASQAGWELNATLNAWARETAKQGEDRDRDPLAQVNPSDTAEMALWLKRNTEPALRLLVDASTAFDEITDGIRRARNAIDHPNTRSRFYVGPCPEEIDGEPCDGQVWVFIASSPDDLSHMACGGCEMKWKSDRWLRVGPRIERRRQQLNQQAAAA